MLSLFESHILPILEERQPKTILEIGVLRGDTTLKLLEWCSANKAHLTSIDPVAWDGELPERIKEPWPGYKYKRGQPDYEDWVIVPVGLEEVFRRQLEANWTCIKTRSLEYLGGPEFKGFDLYLIDGDHNHYTVTCELNLIKPYFKPKDALIFDDVCGPWAKKDMYYDPDFIPSEHYRGRRQGVLTAINDFLDSNSERRLWMRKNCPYKFQMLTKKRYGLGVLTRIA